MSPAPKLTRHNIDATIEQYTLQIEEIGSSIRRMTGLRLLEALKRREVKAGPYPDVTLFEAANRIMTDLVILYGVKWLLSEYIFPFRSYAVAFGHSHGNGFDIQASEDGKKLVGEAFNVAPSFLQGKKSSMLRKLRTKGKDADFTVVMFNHDAIREPYKPRRADGNYYVFVNVGKGAAEMIPMRVD
jgi:hypothetical protein